MKFFPTSLFSVILLLWSSQLFAQNPTTYSLEIHSIISEHGNTLGPVVALSINDQQPDWQKVSSGEGDYHIRVDFLEGLDTKQYHRKKVDRRQYIYQVKYITPRYDAIVTDRTGKTILQKNYGGEMVINPFGADDQYASPDTLARSWEIHRDAFYELEEAKYNNVNVMLEDFFAIVHQEATAIVETIETKVDKPAVTDISPVDPSSNTVNLETNIPSQQKEQKEEVVLAIVENKVNNNTPTSAPRATNTPKPKLPISNNSRIPSQNTTVSKTNKIKDKVEENITPQVPNRDLKATNEDISISNQPSVEAPTPYTGGNKKENNDKDEIGNDNKNNNGTTEEAAVAFEDTKVESNKIDPNTGLVAGETKPVPTPQKRKVESAEEASKPKETDAERKARLERIQAEWDEMDKADEEKNKRPRVRHVRLGARTLFPIFAGGYGEVVLPVLDNRISIVGDFSRLSFADVIKPFLEGDSGLNGIDVIYRYYSVGANYYFRKKYARGWYLGASYLNNIVKTEVKATGDNNLKADVGVDAAALRLGVTTGRNAFFFGFEVGAGVPLGNLKGGFYSETDGELELEDIDENIGIVPILNITLGVAL